MKMMREYVKATDATLWESVAVEAGTALATRLYSTYTFEVIAVGASVGATVIIEASLDGTHWVTYETFILTEASNQMYNVDGARFTHVRASVTAWTVGKITVLTLLGE